MGNEPFKTDDNIYPGIYGEVRTGRFKPRESNIPIAVKIINLDSYFKMINRPIDSNQRDNYIEQIKKRISELEELTGNNRNRNFNRYYNENLSKDNNFYLLMELCDNNLSNYLRYRKLDIGEIYDILIQLNNTFQIMSNSNITHGNMKLENILVKDNTFKLSGFEIIPDLIKYTRDYRPEKVCNYLPPELLRKSDNFNIDQATDLWSLGVIIYYLFFGEFPFNGNSCQEVLSKIEKNNKKKTNFKELDNLIDGLLTIDKEERLTWEKYFNHPFFQNNGFWRKYKIIHTLGESPGQLSTVYKVQNKDDRKEYALKIIDFSKIEKLEKNINNQNDIIKEIKDKIDKMERLSNDNPDYFVKIIEKFDIERGIALIMELFALNLKEHLKSLKDPKASDVFFLLAELNQIFKILQNNSVIIGDLKLENILLKPKHRNSPDFIYKLSDVGLCPKLINLKKSQNIKENIVYLPPELYNGDKYETSCDLWSLGIIIHYFRFGRFPYDADSVDEIMNQIGSGQDRIGKSDNDNFQKLLVGLLERDAKKRLNWNDYFHHPFFTDRQYKGYYEILKEICHTTYYSINMVKEKKTGLEKVMKIINKDTIRKKYFEEHLKPIDEKIITNLVDFSIKQTEFMKIIEDDGVNENTVKFFEYFNTKEEFAIVMEKCDSDLCHYFIDRTDNFNLEEIKNILYQINNSLKIMVKHNIIHGDIKLENILIKKNENNEPVYKLTDYGGSKEFLGLAQNFFDTGKPEYTAPEILNEGILDVKSDLWSLGVLIYRLFFRKSPYEGFTNREVLKAITSKGQTELKSSNNPEFDHLIRTLLTVDLKERLSWEQYFMHPFLVQGDCWKFYTDRQKIGSGDYYDVYKAKYNDSEEFRAIKVIDLKTIKSELEKYLLHKITPEDLKPYLDDFIKETENMELLRGKNKDNKNTVIFYQYFQTEDQFCIVQELCDGSLNALLSEKKKFTVKEIYQILKQLNNSFRILHENNLSHKDLRLKKILIKKDEKGENIYKLTGLEFNRRVEKLLGGGGIMTNEKYKAPEILQGEISNKEISAEELNLKYQKADLWSLGVIIYILYFGEFPYEGINAGEIVNSIMKSDNSKLNEISDNDLKDLVKQLLTDEINDRIDWKGYFNHKFFSGKK